MTSDATTPVGEWIEWHGGLNPVPGKQVDIKRRNGRGSLNIDSEQTASWRHGSYPDPGLDIVAYRLVSAPAVEGEGETSSRGDGEGYLSWLMRATVFGEDVDRFVVTKGDLRGVLSLIPGPTPSPAPDREEIVGVLREIERRCADYDRINLVGKSPNARRAGTIRNVLILARSLLAKLEGKS